ncbi:V-type ATP synthase subunit D [Tannockella kyphosi]|uniref:V-type ATP synthase subunit D n=1 Tax=Tannockella kyphosi TaxID=2899121 RepID=UPI002012AFB4|nr:V-type ATP synthase subunit D [Tannockella kyphosi]
MAIKVVPTKGNLIAIKKSLSLAKLGYDLLDKKRNVLTKEMMELVEDVKVLRDQITDAYQEAYRALEEANISLGIITNLAKATPVDTGISIAYRSVMGVEIPKITYQSKNAVPFYDLERTNSKVDYAFECFAKVKELTVLLAQIENSVFRLANAIRKTQKRANALQNVSIPEFEETVKLITESLEEKEREEFTRQKVIKQRSA